MSTEGEITRSAAEEKPDYTRQRLGLPPQDLAVVPQVVDVAAAAAAGDSSGSTGPSLAERQQQDLETEAELAGRTAVCAPQLPAASEVASMPPPGPEDWGVQQALAASTRRFVGRPVRERR